MFFFGKEIWQREALIHAIFFSRCFTSSSYVRFWSQKFLNYWTFLWSKRWLFNLYFKSFIKAEKTPQGICKKTQKPLFPNWRQNIHPESLIVPKKELSASKTALSEVEISYESKGVPFDQMKASEKTHRAEKNLKTVFSTIIRKTHLFLIIKKEQRGHPQGSKNFKNENFKNFFFEIFLPNCFHFGK